MLAFSGVWYENFKLNTLAAGVDAGGAVVTGGAVVAGAVVWLGVEVELQPTRTMLVTRTIAIRIAKIETFFISVLLFLFL